VGRRVFKHCWSLPAFFEARAPRQIIKIRKLQAKRVIKTLSKKNKKQGSSLQSLVTGFLIILYAPSVRSAVLSHSLLILFT
jgi:hypothetical protein